MLGSMRSTIAQSDHRRDQWIRGLYTDGRRPDPMHISGSSDLVRSSYTNKDPGLSQNICIF